MKTRKTERVCCVLHHVGCQKENSGALRVQKVHVRKVMNDVKELLNKGDIESFRLKLKSQKINLEKHQKEIESLDREIAELLQADAIEKEILERCEFKASLQETILLITSCLSSSKKEANDVEMVTLPTTSPNDLSLLKMARRAQNRVGRSKFARNWNFH